MEPRDAIAGAESGRFSDIRWVEQTGSTNADVMELARQGAAEGIVIVADHQIAGRGRAGRTWTAPPGASLLCTVLLRPPAPVAPLVTFALAVSAADAVEELTGFRPGLKWPNDLVVETDGRTRKLAGILAEAEWPASSTASGGHRVPAAHERAVVAAGIGLNVAWPGDLPDDLAEIAVALNQVCDAELDRSDVLERLLANLEKQYALLLASDREAVLEAWRRSSATLGTTVRVDLGADEVVGTAIDVTDEGHLVVETVGGVRRTLAVGDVVHLRPGT